MDVWFVRLAATIVLLSLPALPADTQEPAVRPEMVLQIGPGFPVTSVAFSPDGRRLACVGEDATVFVWDVRSQGLVFAPGLGGPLNAVRFSPDGKLIAVAGNAGGALGAVFLLDATDGRTLRRLDAGGPKNASTYVPREATSVVFSPDSKTVIGAFDDGRIIAWDTRSGAQQATRAGKTGQQIALTLSRDGKTLACGTSEGFISLLDAKTLAPVRSAKWGTLFGLAFSEDGKVLAGAGSTGVKGVLWLWDTTTGKLTKTITKVAAPLGGGNGVAFSPDGKTLALVGVESVTLVNPKTSKRVRSIPMGDTAVQCLAFSPNGRMLAWGGEDASVKIWDPQTGKQICKFEGLPAAEAVVASVAFSPDGRTLACLREDGVSLWDLESIPPSRFISLSDQDLSAGFYFGSLTFSTDGKQLAGIVGAPRLWDARTGEPAKPVFESGAKIAMPELAESEKADEAIAQPLMAVAFSPHGTLLASDAGDIWDTRTGELKRTLFGSCGVAFSPDGKTLATGGTEKPEAELGVVKRRAGVKLWDVETGNLKRLLLGNEGEMAFNLSFLPDGRSVAAGTGPLHGDARGKTVLWNVDTGEVARTFEGGALIGASGDGKTLVTCYLANSDLRQAPILWDTQTGRLIRTLGEPEAASTAFALSRDGTRAAIGRATGEVTLWDAAAGRPLVTLLVLPYSLSESKPRPMEWIAYTPEGLFDSSEAIAKHIRWRIGSRLLTTEDYESTYHSRQPQAVRKAASAQ